MKIINRGLVFFALFIFLAACSNKDDRPLVIVDNFEIKEDSWIKDPELVSSSIVRYLISVPILYSKSYVMAEDISELTDGSIEIKLKKDIYYHDGRPFLAENLADLVKAMSRDKEDEFSMIFRDVEVEVVDDLKLKVSMNRILADKKSLLGEIMPVILGVGAPWMGNGPYMVKNWFEGGLELTANERYFEGPPQIKKIKYLHEKDERKRLKMLLDGRADLMVLPSARIANFLKNDERFYVNSTKAHQSNGLLFNMKSDMLSDSSIRKAISMAINRNILIEKGLLSAGEKAYSPFPYNGEGIESQEYRPSEAIRLLKAAGWKYNPGSVFLEKDGNRLRLRLYYPKEVDNYFKIANLISNGFYELGIETEIVEVDYFDFVESGFKNGEAAMLLSPLGKSISRWHSSGEDNISGYGNKKADILLEKLVASPNEEEKRDIYSKLNDIFEDDVPAIFLYHDLMYAVASRRFRGAEDFIADVYSVYKIKDWVPLEG